MEKKKTLFKSSEFCISILMFAFSFIILTQVFITDVEESKIMPMLVFIICFLSALALFVQSIKRYRGIDDVGKLKIGKKETITIFVLFLSYFTINILGFYTSMFILTTGFSMVLWDMKSKKSVAIMLIYNFVLNLIMQFMFSNCFGMVMPRGMFI